MTKSRKARARKPATVGPGNVITGEGTTPLHSSLEPSHLSILPRPPADSQLESDRASRNARKREFRAEKKKSKIERQALYDALGEQIRDVIEETKADTQEVRRLRVKLEGMASASEARSVYLEDRRVDLEDGRVDLEDSLADLKDDFQKQLDEVWSLVNANTENFRLLQERIDAQDRICLRALLDEARDSILDEELSPDSWDRISSGKSTRELELFISSKMKKPLSPEAMQLIFEPSEPCSVDKMAVKEALRLEAANLDDSERESMEEIYAFVFGEQV
ncbi:hypothetical protein JAAARDRAFT_215519 [Jaapia argillacea MUCL 33604]|uniref:Uncharacterized protein n=1 Tax=Jaapia argillacea MUCL 33604 TaxID=933084 RepID=A0A067QAT8_9AGAM|nr:hypothetical protein JAAARDRAFT_215519 [Jaapia argillacea MUCL 33604]